MSDHEPTKLEKKRHSLAHLLAMAVLKKYPNAKLGIGPTIDNGFYYDFDIGGAFKDGDIKEFQKTVKKLIGQKLETTGKEVSEEEAKEMFKDQPFKLDLIDEYAKEGRTLTAYTTGDFTDLCRGGHVDNTSEIEADALKLTTIAGAYWRGDEKNAQLQRIYGIAFDTQKELKEYEAMLVEAKKRDHRKLGRDLDLFVFSELIGPGLPLWTPKGTIVRNLLDNKVWEMRKARGYMQVDIPHITKKDLYEKSGHWEKFSDELFRIKTREDHEFALKPMNCPHHTQIYDRKPHSYKELPVRYANTTKVYRDEQTGELAGLTRVRSITQDDAHVFCRTNQAQDEMGKIWDIIEEFYGLFGFGLQVRLSLHDPKESAKYLGTEDSWDSAEGQLRSLVKARKVNAEEALGEAAMYGPKIDFVAKDSLGRTWQVATIQLDLNQPERFDLNCINEKGEKERIVMIHAAIMGSIERFMATLIEHLGGAFPYWLAPVQVRILTVNDKVSDYAREVMAELEKNNVRVEIDERNESINKKVREGDIQKIPYLMVLGDKEAKDKTISARCWRDKETKSGTLEKFLTEAGSSDK
ncbi:MAG: threonine--tRNA ligase [bacterium]|nr:threonine--tRNA ligase [bacterium]